ncbi:hypothetical protein CsatB_012336 [Cannabis sativa]
MVFFSTWICISIDVVLCNIPLLSKLLSERPKRESWTCCFSDSCFGMYNRSDNCGTSCCFVILVNMMPLGSYIHISASSMKLKTNDKSGVTCIFWKQLEKGDFNLFTQNYYSL